MPLIFLHFFFCLLFARPREPGDLDARFHCWGIIVPVPGFRMDGRDVDKWIGYWDVMSRSGWGLSVTGS